MKPLTPLCAALTLLLLSAAAPALCQSAETKTVSAAPSKPVKVDKALRIFLNTGTKKTYVRGYQWMTLDLNRKISLIESARRGALRMNAVMALPAETYVRETDKFFSTNPSLMQMELGQVLQGLAISLKDWDDGTTGA